MKKRSLFLILLLAVFMPWAAMAQTPSVTIGSGTAKSPYLPGYNYYNYAISQQIYTAEEINASGTITSIAFYKDGTENSNGSRKFDIYMAHTTKTGFEASTTTTKDWIALTDADIVYHGTANYSFTNNAWNTFTLETPFNYNGTDNLVVCVIDRTGNCSSSSTYANQYRVFSTGSEYQAIYKYNDNYSSLTPDGHNGTTVIDYSRMTSKNQIILGGIQQTCARPTNLTATLDDTDHTIATLSWTENGEATSWVLQVATNNTFTEGLSSYNVSGTSSKDLSGLTPETVYYARVRPTCSETLWSDVCSFWPTATVPVVVNEGTTTNGYVPFYGSNITYGTPNKGQFIIPAANLENINPGSTLKRMTLHSTSYYSNVSWGNATFNVYLKEVTDESFASATFVTDGLTTVYQGNLAVTNSQMEITLDQDFTYNGGNLLVGFELASSTGGSNGYVSWYGVNGSGNNSIYTYMGYSSQTGPTRITFMPKVTFRVLQAEVTCDKPKNLAASNITHNQATITWTSDESAWNIAWSTDPDFDPQTQGSHENNYNQKTYTITGLNPLTNYYVAVQSNCGGDWSNKLHFKTTAEAVVVGDSWSDDFEGTSCGWDLINGELTNKWCWGTAVNNGGTHALYVSNDNGNTNSYNISGYHKVFAAKLLNFAEGKFTFSYDWKGTGESTYDFMRVALVPASQTLTAGTDHSTIGTTTLPTGWIALDGSNKLNQQSTWTNKEVTINVAAGNYYLVLAWRQDNSGGTNPPAAVDNVSITRILCPYEVAGLAVATDPAPTAHTATINWTAGEPGSWQVEWAKNSSFTGASSETVTTNTINLTNLDASSTYYVRVRAYCGGTDYGAWSSAVNFDTECEAVSTYPWNENFDSYTGSTSGTTNNLPLCWNYINTTTYSSQAGYPIIYNSSYSSHSGNNYLYFYSSYSTYGNTNPQPQYAILPEMTNLNGKQIEFYAKGYNSTDKLKVGIMTAVDNASTFVQIGEDIALTTSYQKFIVSLASYEGTGHYIALMIEAATSTTSRYAYVDDISVKPLPDCATPTGLAKTANSETPEGATITWTAGEGTEWTVEYKKTSEENWTPVTPNVTEATYTFTGLVFNTQYQARVSVACTGITYPTDPVSFTTKVQFPAPTNLVTSNLTHESATLSWTPGYTNQTAWKVEYKKSSENWTDATTETVSNPTIDLSTLVENTTYNVRIYGGIGENFGTDYLPGNFTTKYACAAPTNLQVSNVTDQSVTLNWTPGYQETTWTVKYKLSTVSSWEDESVVTIPDATKPLTIDHLTAGTTYNVQVINCENALSGSFTTAFGVPFMQDFEATTSSIPSGWNRYSGLLSEVLAGTVQLSSTTSYWSFGSYEPVGNYCAQINIYGTSCKYWLTTPVIINNNNDNSLSFEMGRRQFSAGTCDDDIFAVLYSIDNGATWTVLARWDNAGSEYVYNNIPVGSTIDVYLALPAETKNKGVCFAFYGESTTTNGDYYLCINDVSVDATPTCFTPTDVTVSNVTTTSATISWTNNNGNDATYTVMQGTTPLTTNAVNSYILNSLTVATTYPAGTFTIIANCDETLVANVPEFNTPICEAADQCQITLELTDSWGDGWGGNTLSVVDVETNIVLGEFTNQNLNGTTGSGTNEMQSFTLNVCDDREIKFVFAGTNYTSENSFVIYNNWGQVICQVSSPANNAGVVGTYTVNCTEATFTKTILAHSEEGAETMTGWYLIASPLNDAVSVDNVGHMKDNNFDLYRFNQAPTPNNDGEYLEWENWKAEGEHNHFDLEPGKGYLYANSGNVELTFTGVPYSGEEDMSITLSKTNDNPDTDMRGWNLVGNPYSVNAYINHEFYVMNSDGNDIVTPNRNYIEPMEGAFVLATEDEELLTFYKTPVTSTGNQGSLSINVMEAANHRGNRLIDRAVVRFGEGNVLPKFQLNPNHTKIYIPQGDERCAVVYSEAAGEMPVNFKAEENGTYTLSFTNEEVTFSYLHLIDNLTGNDIDLLQTPSYTFNATTTDYSSRFKLVFCTGINNDSDSFAFFSNGNWIIGNEGEATLQVIDVTGRILSSETVNGSVSKAINAAPGVYMIRLINGDNVKVQKIVVK